MTSIITADEAKDKIIKSGYSVKNVKTMPGHDGPAMSCTLYKDGKRVATVFDDSWGGGYQYDYLKNCKKFENNLLKFSESMYVKTKHGFDITYNPDCVIDVLVEEFQINKQYKKWCKKSTCFRLKGDKDGVWRTINAQFNDDVKNFIAKKYGDKVVEILNETLIK